MRRKVVQQGPSTMMVSLPMPWVKANSIKKGNDLVVEIVNNQLIISPETQKEDRKAIITIKSREEYVDRIIISRYREGFDELQLKFDDPQTIEDIRETLKYLLGFEIVDQSKNTCTIKNISEGSEEEYQTMFRRIFQMVVTMGESNLEYATTKEISSLKTTVELRETLIKLEQFNLRLINKQNTHSLQKKSLEFFYVWHLGGFGRMWASFAKLCIEQKTSFSKEDIDFLEDTVIYLKDFQHTFYKREIKNIIRIKKKLYELRPIGANLLNTSKNKLHIFYLLRMINRVYEVSLTF